MTDGKKGLLTIILGRGKPADKPAGDSASDDGAEGDDQEGAKAAAEELLSAIEKKDTQAVVDAFKAMMDCCATEED